MKIEEKKNTITVIWSKTKEADLTWGDVKEFCRQQIEKIDTSKESDEIKAIITTIRLLNNKVNAFNKRRGKYEKMYLAIRENELTKKVGGDGQ